MLQKQSDSREAFIEQLIGTGNFSVDDVERYRKLPEQSQVEAISLLAEMLPVGMIGGYCEEGFPLYFVNSGLYCMMGYDSYEEFLTAIEGRVENTIYAKDLNRVEQELGDNYYVGMEYTITYRMPRKDGSLFWVLDKGRVVEAEDHRLAIISFCIDITERVQLRERLNASIRAFKIAAKEERSLVFTYNREEQAIYCDEELAESFGVEVHQTDVPYGIVKRGNIVSEDTVEEYLRIHETILHGGKEASGIVKLTNVDGKERIFELKIQNVPDEEGELSNLAVGLYKDITEQYVKARELEKSKLDLQEKYLTVKEKLDTESRERLDMIYALSRDYYALWRVDLRKDLIFLRSNENRRTTAATDKDQRIPDSYTESLKVFAEKWVHPGDRAILFAEANIERIRVRLKVEEAYSIRLRRKRPDAENYGYVEWRIGRLADNDETYAALIAVKDVTGKVLREAQRQDLLKDALAQAEHANRAKTTFLSNMSHDIRTPMNAIIGFTAIAASHIDNKERVQDCLTKIMSSSNHLLSLINDILDMSRIESGKITIQEKECNLSERIHNLVDMIRPQMRAKQLEFLVDIIDVKDENLIFDPLRLDQVLINILSNAVKFTPVGGIVSFGIRQSESERPGFCHYEFVVRDTGIGMSEEFLKRIYEPFERENTSTISGSEGTGLGMAIARNTVDMMGGTIEVESKSGKGSTFTVGFDFKRQKISGGKERNRELEGLRALVVDDDFQVCDSVTKMLTQIGMRSDWTTSGREAVFRAQKAHDDGDPFHSYIIDWLMPQMDGIETVRRIRKVIGDEVPIIVLTAYDWTDIEEEAREAGVTAFCSKPLFISDLCNILLKANQLSDKKGQLPKQAELNFLHSKVLVVEDNELNREIITEILTDSGFEVENASDGSIAVDMVRNMEENYYDLILMDIQMPVMDGYEATRMIRNLPRQDVVKLPIIAMTANAFEEDRERALENGMNAHIAKPLNVDTLLVTLKRILSSQ